MDDAPRRFPPQRSMRESGPITAAAAISAKPRSISSNGLTKRLRWSTPGCSARAKQRMRSMRAPRWPVSRPAGGDGARPASSPRPLPSPPCTIGTHSAPRARYNGGFLIRNAGRRPVIREDCHLPWAARDRFRSGARIAHGQRPCTCKRRQAPFDLRLPCTCDNRLCGKSIAGHRCVTQRPCQAPGWSRIRERQDTVTGPAAESGSVGRRRVRGHSRVSGARERGRSSRLSGGQCATRMCATNWSGAGPCHQAPFRL